MPTMYILDTPEFEPIVTTARLAGMDVRPTGDYLEAVSPQSTVTLERRHTEVRPSIWFATLTGGMVGHNEQFDHDVLRLADDD